MIKVEDTEKDTETGKIFRENVQCVQTNFWMDDKMHFLFAFITTTRRHCWIKMESAYIEPQGPFLSAKVLFVKIDPADWTLHGDNQGYIKLCIFV